jgi:hypothetical protein
MYPICSLFAICSFCGFGNFGHLPDASGTNLARLPPRAGLSRGDNQLEEETQDTERNAPPAHRHFRKRALEKHDQSLEDVYLDAD